MKFITKQQIIDAGEKVAVEIFKWWKPEAGDLVVIGEDEVGDVVTEHKDSGVVDCIWGNFRLDNSNEESTFPLLTIGQLIEFIEYKLNDEIDIYRAGMKGHQISTEWIDGVGESKFEFVTDTHDLLLALWECVQEVCK